MMGSFVLSLSVHFFVLLPVLVFTMLIPKSPVQGEYAVDELQEMAQELDDVKLGLDESKQSSMTWVGYDTYQEHLAQLADVDQAAFTVGPTGSQAPPGPQVPIPPQPQPTEQTPPTKDVSEETVTERVLAKPPVGSPLAAENTVNGAPALPTAAEPRIVTEAATSEKPVTEPKPDPAPEPEGQEADPAPKTEAEPKPDPKPEEEPPPPTPQPGGGGEGETEDVPDEPAEEPRPADASDKESDATSVIDVPQQNWKSGRPLASQGLELKPKRPSFTELQSLTSAPGDLGCEIRFGGDGRPVLASILHSSGDQRIDRVFLASLYGWRARGELLDALEDGQTANIQLRIVLTSQ